MWPLLLMVLIAVEELIDINPFHGLRFGNLLPVEPGAIERYPMAGAIYDVELFVQGLNVVRNGQALFFTDTPWRSAMSAFKAHRFPAMSAPGARLALPWAKALRCQLRLARLM